MKSITAIILILVSGGLFFFQINPQYADVKILRAQGAEYDQALKVAEELKAVRNQLSDKLSSFTESELQSLERFMPQRLDTIRVIIDVNNIAEENGIEIKSIKTTDSAKDSGNTPAQAQSPYNTTSISFSLTSSYNNAEKFIQDLEKSLRLIDASIVNIKPSTTKPGSYDFDMTLNTYWVGKK